MPPFQVDRFDERCEVVGVGPRVVAVPELVRSDHGRRLRNGHRENSHPIFISEATSGVGNGKWGKWLIFAGKVWYLAETIRYFTGAEGYSSIEDSLEDASGTLLTGLKNA